MPMEVLVKFLVLTLFAVSASVASATSVQFECSTDVSINQITPCPRDADGYETMCGNQSHDIQQGPMKLKLKLDSSAKSCSGTLLFQNHEIALNCADMRVEQASLLGNISLEAHVALATPLYGGAVKSMALRAGKWVTSDETAFVYPSTEFDFVDVGFGQMMADGQLQGSIRYGSTPSDATMKCRQD